MVSRMRLALAASVFVLFLSSACDRDTGRTGEPSSTHASPRASAGLGITTSLRNDREHQKMLPELMTALRAMTDLTGLADFTSPTGTPFGSGTSLKIYIARPEYPALYINAVATPVGPWRHLQVAAGTCKYREDLDYTVERGCEVRMDAVSGWAHLKRFLDVLQAGFPPSDLDPETAYPLPYPPPPGDYIFMRAFLEYGPDAPVHMYAVRCEVSDPNCTGVWQVATQEFWLPVITRYPFLPQGGAPPWDHWGRISDDQRASYLSSIPEIVVGEDTYGEPLSGPSPYWTEADEAAFRASLQNPPPPP
jgi:hypothetical protein